MIDLHCHSSFSDGALSPEELIQKAVNHKIHCLSLTDHDTVAGYAELNRAALNTSIKVVNGIEFSARWKKHDIHILGYQINHTSNLNNLIEQQNNSRVLRAEQIGVALESIGIKEAFIKACELAGHNRVGRPHFAQVLIQEKRTRDMKTAFKQYLGRGKIAYVPTPWMSLQEAAEGIVTSGGRAVIAHPLKYGLTRSRLHELINEFKEAGGVGIEVVSGEMNSIQINEMANTSIRFNLLASSGSDFHSDALSRINLGRQQQLPVNCTPIWHDWNI